jgi:hypothetical protein
MTRTKRSRPRVSEKGTTTLPGSLKGVRAAKKSWAAYLLKKKGMPAPRVDTALTPNLGLNLMGVGIGEKISDGRRTGVLSVKFLVRAKYHQRHIGRKHLLPKSIGGIPTDIEEVGLFRRLAINSPADTPNPQTRLRPAQPGCSVGFADPSNLIFTAGTFGALVKDAKGVYILGNNHVLADENQLGPGALIFQPGLLDDDNPASDLIAELKQFIPLQSGAYNKVDCAIATVDSVGDVSNSILHIGPPKGTTAAATDMIVHKFGRSTGYTVGRISSIEADATVQFQTGSFTFQNQIVIEGLDSQPFSDSGDSGSLILDRSTNAAVGLLFGGSGSHSLANHIDDVLAALSVTLA